MAKNSPYFHDLDSDPKDEICNQICQESSNLILRNWMEVRQLLLQYIYKSIYSPFCPCKTIFARDEYQDFVGNLPHIYALIRMNRDQMTQAQKAKIDKLIQGSYGDIITINDLESFIDENTIFHSMIYI